MNLILRDRNSLVDDFFKPFFNDYDRRDLGISVNLKENENSYLIKADLPGVEEKDVEVKFDNGLLTISGERKEEKEEETERCYRSEISYGKFSRSFRFGDEVDVDKVSAKFKNGVLKLELPKVEAKKPRIISLN